MDSARRLMAMMMAVLLADTLGCPRDCSCRWKSGKESVDCSRKGLKDIPKEMASGTQVLNMSGNPLLTLPSHVFLQAGLLNLQRIYISRCNVKQIGEFAFARLTNLIDLDLSYNSLVSVPSKSFNECPVLRRLVLSGNPISKLDANAFSRLSFLTILELSHCQVAAVAPRAFDGLAALTHLKLDGNQLTMLKGGVVAGLVSLHGAALHGNPWRCDCALREMRAWLMKGRVPCPIPPVCEHPPRVRGIPLERVDGAELACEPRGSADETLEVFVGNDALLRCRINAVPEAQVRWTKGETTLVNWTLVLPNRRYLIVENGTADKISTLVISDAQQGDSGFYSCVASNRAGEWHAGTTLHVLSPSLATVTLSRTYVVALMVSVLLAVFAAVLVAVLARRRHVGVDKDKSVNIAGVNHEGFSGDGVVVVDQSKSIRRTLLSSCHEIADGRVYAKSFLENNFHSRPDVINVQAESAAPSVDANGKWPCSVGAGNGSKEEGDKRATRYALFRTFESSDDLFCGDQIENNPFVTDQDTIVNTET
uniref:Ig-like domain-containing protein n=1 Tax=Strigamia maritima TaxID=126957 RepID=T1J1D1_STRMM